jgi:hypothetical protein
MGGMMPDLSDPIQLWLMELLEHYTLPGEAVEAFPEWWEELKEILDKKRGNK